MKIYQRFIKRPLDILISGSAILVLAIPMSVVMLWLRRANEGAGVLFFQERQGKGKTFHMVKLKSMCEKRDEKGNLLPDKERLTKAGRFIRATSLDEIPQLWNVLKGDMSMIGPRPQPVWFNPYYSEEEFHRHDVLPGITGMAQVNGRDNISWKRKFGYDLWYVKNISFLTDCRIIWKSIKCVWSHEGASIEGRPANRFFTGHENDPLRYQDEEL